MKNLKTTLVLSLLIALIVFGVAFEYQIRRFFSMQGSFELTDIPLTDISGRPESIEPNDSGYVIFYSDLLGCSACMLRLGNLSGLDKIYPEVGFFAICKKDDEKVLFAEKMLEYEVPGQFLVDELKVLEGRLNLCDRPLLLFFTKDNKLMASIPMDVDYLELKKQIHNFINEL